MVIISPTYFIPSLSLSLSCSHHTRSFCFHQSHTHSLFLSRTCAFIKSCIFSYRLRKLLLLWNRAILRSQICFQLAIHDNFFFLSILALCTHTTHTTHHAHALWVHRYTCTLIPLVSLSLKLSPYRCLFLLHWQQFRKKYFLPQVP